MKAPLLALLFLLAGCQTDVEFARSGATYSPNYPPEIVRVPDPHSYCKMLGARVVVTGGQQRNGDAVRLVDLNITHEAPIHGCSDWMGTFHAKRCSIFVGDDAPAWLIEHEKLHCIYGNFHR